MESKSLETVSVTKMYLTAVVVSVSDTRSTVQIILHAGRMPPAICMTRVTAASLGNAAIRLYSRAIGLYSRAIGLYSRDIGLFSRASPTARRQQTARQIESIQLHGYHRQRRL